MNAEDYLKVMTIQRLAKERGFVITVNPDRFFEVRPSKRYPEYSKDVVLHRGKTLEGALGFLEGFAAARDYVAIAKGDLENMLKKDPS